MPPKLSDGIFCLFCINASRIFAELNRFLNAPLNPLFSYHENANTMHLNRRIQQVGAPHDAIILDKNQQKSPEAIDLGAFKFEGLRLLRLFLLLLALQQRSTQGQRRRPRCLHQREREDQAQRRRCRVA